MMAHIPTYGMADDDDVVVERDRRRDFDDRIVRIRVLRVPVFAQFLGGVKYAYHFGEKGADDPILRYDNHHDIHERHAGTTVEEIDFPGPEVLLERFIGELPDDIAP